MLTVAGSIAGFADGPGGVGIAFNSPSAVAYSPDGSSLYILDTGNNRVRVMAPSGAVGTLAGSGANNFVDGQGLAAG